MLPDQNGRGRPGRRPHQVVTHDLTPTSVAADDFTVSVLRGAYWQLSMAETELCAECVTARRHPDSQFCTGCLGAGAGDVGSAA